jgi:hypothetical protein
MKIQGIGLPFSSHQSSCSNRNPKNFEWTNDDAEVEVWMDMKIPEAINIPIPKGKKRYAWFCESRAIVPQLRQAFEQEDIFNDIINSYDAIFTCEKELIVKHDKIHFCFAGSNLPWIENDEYEIHNKTKLASFVSSNKLLCKGHNIRHQIYWTIENNEVDIDTFGGITGNPFGYMHGCHVEENPDKRWHDKSEALNDYMFSIVIENDKYDDYFTEKITDCFATGTIPVYWGCPRIGEYFNIDGIVSLSNGFDLNSLTPELYYSKMDAVKDNFNRVKEMKMADDMIYEKIVK